MYMLYLHMCKLAENKQVADIGNKVSCSRNSSYLGLGCSLVILQLGEGELCQVQSSASKGQDSCHDIVI